MSSTRTRHNFIIVRVALWCALLAAVTYTSTDPDLWGNVRFGLDILRDGSVPHTDPYSFTTDREWVNHEWLAEVFIGDAFRAGGDVGLILLKVATIGALLLLLGWTLRREGVSSPIVLDAAAAAAVVLAFDQVRYVRPQLFSLLAFAVLLSCLTATQRGFRRALLWLPPLFAVWANVHGGWLVGGGVFALWTFVTVAVGPRREALWYVATGAASLAGTLVNPYGVELWTFLRDTVGFNRADIVEWQPIYVLGWQSCLPWAATAALAVAGVVAEGRAGADPAAKRFKTPAERLVCVALLAVASAMVLRLQAFFALSVFFLVVPAIGRAYAEGRERGNSIAREPASWLVRTTCIGVAAASLVVSTSNMTHLRIDPRWTPESGAVAFLNSQPADRRVLLWFDWGGYALWHLAPRMRISMDGRRETVYSPELQDRHLRFYFDAPGGASLPTDLTADYVWIPRMLPAVHRLEAEGWHRLYEGEQSVIFGRAGPTTPNTPVMLAAESNARFFPGP
jgi:hypothetical protein